MNPGPAAGARADAGSATAELALALPTLLVVLLVGVYVLAGLALRGRCADAARAVVREAARGDDPEPARSRVLAALPAGAEVVVDRTPSAGTVTVTVRAPLPAPGPLRPLLRDERLVGVSTAADESAGPAAVSPP